ncbi:hypothetical protein Syun_020493 [Stephania yunnanensis]|uniref:Uncharacterized protein n=1 Tax=Stephania yunnanensis TaxID=152371 RepID=A0AAP0NRH7_9MAGN
MLVVVVSVVVVSVVVTIEDRPPWPTERVRKKMAGVSHAINFDGLGMDAKV